MNDGRSIPQLGFGVYQLAPGEETANAVSEALKAGYRHIDTAQFYRNEADVAQAIRSGEVRRDEIFVTTKLSNPNQGYESAKRSLARSLAAGFAYFDLFLIHFPVTAKRADSWRALLELKEQGLCKSVGVSNYTIRHLQELLDSSPVKPAVNQVEISPFLPQKELREFCAKHEIVVEAYSPLTQGKKLGHPAIVAAAQKAGKTPAQVMLRWCVQHDLVVLPKSATPERIIENAAIFDFELDADTMSVLDGLDENLRNSWDPTDVP